MQPRVVMVLQARMGSTRLPGKSMLPLAGRPLVARVLERVKRCRVVDDIVLATTRKGEDDPLVDVAGECGLRVFRGSENDLVDRYYQCARQYNADVVVRIPADNPAPEPSIIDQTVSYHLSSDNDFSTSYPDVLDNGFPDGVGCEVYNMNALEEVWRTSSDPRNREHPHTNFYENPDRYRMGAPKCPAELRRPDIVLDVNTQAEYDFMVQLYEDLYPANPCFTISDIIDWYDRVYRGAKFEGDDTTS